MTYAPVALFVYNRPWHTHKTVEALLANAEASETPLFVFSDAAKNIAAREAVLQVREYINKIAGFKSVTVIERDHNLGLAESIIGGVTQVCGQYGRVIVLEDDIVTSQYFLRFMNDGLRFYADDDRVISISGYVYPIKQELPETFFLRGADCWGWATWQRAWELFERDGRVLLRDLEQNGLTHAFDSNGTYPFTQMLRNQINKKTNSWAIRWHATAFVGRRYTLYPGRTLVHNIGVDGSGTNCAAVDDFSGDMANSPIVIEAIPVEENSFAREQVTLFHRKLRPPFLFRAWRKLKSALVKRVAK